MFQWTFSQFWPLGLHSNQLKLWNIPSGWKPRGKALLFSTYHIVWFHKRAGEAGLGRAVGPVVWGRQVAGFSPRFCPRPRTPAHLLHVPPFGRSQEDLDKHQATVAIVFIQCLRWATASAQSRGTFMKGRNADKTKISEVCTYISRYKRRIISHNLCKKQKQKKSVRIYSCGREKEREMEGGGIIKSSWSFFNSNFIEGQKWRLPDRMLIFLIYLQQYLCKKKTKKRWDC